MKTKTLISNAGAAFIVALSIVGCQDYDNGFTDKEIAFQEAFKKEFGEIDPEQDWNLATRGTLHVDVNKETNVKIYSGSPTSKSSVLMANYTVSAPSDLGFDMPEGTEQVYVQAISDKKLIVSGYYNVNLLGEVEDVPFPDEESTAPKVKESSTIDFYVYGKTNGNRSHTLHMLEGIPNSRTNSDIVEVPGKWSYDDMCDILGTGGVFTEGADNWEYYIKPGILEKNVMYTIQEGGGEMSVTLEYYRTGTTTNHFAYFYWTGDELPDPESVTLYCLIENASDPNNGYVTVDYSHGSTGSLHNNSALSEGMYQGTTFKLVYFGKDGKATPSFEFPEDTHIGFAVLWKKRSKNENEGDYVITSKEKATDGNTTDHVWFSIQDMNVPSEDWDRGHLFNNGNFGTAATFRLGEKVILGFEDWPETLGSDLNDIMFWVEGDFIEKDDIPQLIPDSDKPQSWVLAYEDLGNSFDWDYNDVVLKVSHVAGQEYIEITPLAAGGTLASYVKLNGLPIRRGKSVGEGGTFTGTLDDGTGEIHQLLGAEATTSGNYAPINAYSRNDGQPIICDFRDYYDDDKSEGLGNAFTMTTLGTIKQMGGITLHVQNDDGSDGEETIEFNINNIGKAPEVMCLPDPVDTWTEEDGDEIVVYEREWRWPAEYQNINYAYDNKEANFAGWAADKNTNKDWYKKEPNREYSVDGTFDKEIYRGDAGGYNPDPDPSGPTFPSDAGDDITEYITDDEYNSNKSQVIPFSLISDYESCVITLQINGTVVVKDDRYGHDYTNDFLAETGIEGIYTITLEDLNAISKFTNGIWFSGATIEKAAIKGKKDSRIPMKIGDNFISTDKIKETEQIDGYFSYDVDLSDYKLDNDFNGTVSIIIKFAENVTHVVIYTDHSWEGSNYVNDERNSGKTEYELNVEISKLKDIINYIDSFNVRFSGSSNIIKSLSIRLHE